jgi:hypothetical protein
VLFDYLGDEQHREYSCIGDHVSFADRLMRKAARFDTDTNEKWPPILISQTAEQYLKYWIGSDLWEEKKKEARRILHAKGYGFPSYVYGLETNCFNLEKYQNIMGPIWKKEKTESEFVDLLTRSYVKNEQTKR